MSSGVDGSIVGNGVLGSTLSADLDDTVRLGLVDEVYNSIVDIGEDDIVTGVVEEASNEATAWRRLLVVMIICGNLGDHRVSPSCLVEHTDVASAEVNSLLAHDCGVVGGYGGKGDYCWCK